MKTISSLRLPLAMIALLTASCSEKKSPVVEGLATVNGKPVTEPNFRHLWSKRPPAEDNTKERAAILDQLIERTALAEAAQKAGLADDPIVVEQVQSLLIGRLRETQLAPKLAAVEVTDDEIERCYQSQLQEKFTQEGRIHAAVLWLDTRGQAPLVARYTPRLEKVRASLIEEPMEVAAGFGETSIANTEHLPSRYKGGDVGWIEEGPSLSEFHGAVRDIAAALTTPGELSEVIARPEGLFLVRLIERKQPRVRELAEVRDAIRKELVAARRAEIETAFKADLVKSFPIERFDDRLSALSGLNPAKPDPRANPTFNPPQLSARKYR